MASHGITDFISQLFGDGLACLLKRRLDKRNPMLLGYLLHENHLAETIERTIGIVEDIEHHVALATIKAVRGQLLLLPNGTHLALHVLILREICQLLKLIDAHDDLDALLPCQNLRQLENRHLVTLLWHKLHVESDKIRYLVVHDNLRNDTCQELLGILYPTFHL